MNIIHIDKNKRKKKHKYIMGNKNEKVRQNKDFEPHTFNFELVFMF